MFLSLISRFPLCFVHFFSLTRCNCLNFIITKGITSELLINCNATYSGFESHVNHLQAYANDQIIRSFDHMLLAVNFGTYVHNRPGFEKTFKGLSDTAWNRGIGLIKHITKRGGAHDFNLRSNRVKTPLELSEIEALGLALDIEKGLAVKAHNIHEMYSHANHKAHYDAEVQTHFFSSLFYSCQIIRRFVVEICLSTYVVNVGFIDIL